MIKSMTGYGKGESTYDRGRITAEIRSVNHRYGEIYVKMPRNLIGFESEVKKAVSERLKRGKIEVFIQHEPSMESAPPLTVNMPLARAYYDALNTLKTNLDLAGEVSLQLIAAQKEVLAADENQAPDETLPAGLLSAVRQAVDNLETMRIREGETLLADLQSRREAIQDLAGKVGVRAPGVVADYTVRLKERLAQLCADQTVSEERLAQEVAIMADRCDITEELVRLDSHLGQFDAALSLMEPVGRKIDFLLQEMGREVNTVGSKANDARIAHYVVEMKTEIEKIREQIQNIE